ncbi:MAG: hypothetical protein ACJA0Q_001434 [Saprospiraceae bacterium]|jgi:hypothetical protein
MKEESKEVLKNMLENFLLKGVLLSVVIFFVGMILNTVVVLLWFKYNNHEITGLHWSIIGFLCGIYPIAVFILHGVFRCLTVLYADVFTAFIKPQIRVITDKSVSKLDSKIQTSELLKKQYGTHIMLDVVNYVDSSLSKFPKLIRVPILWVLKKVNIEYDFLSLVNNLENLSPEETSTKVAEWLEHKLSDLVNDVKPFWTKLLIPIHICLLIGLWFIHLIKV